MTVISLGAGVQSSTMFLMACHGELPKPDVAIFADTQAEPRGVYTFLQFLKEQGDKYDIPVHIVSRGSLKDDTVDYVEGRANRVASIPAFVQVEGQKQEGRMWRQCTNDYKIMVVRKEIRRMLKENPAYTKPIELWIGISTDEILRMKDSTVQYIVNRWPLIEKNMSREDCLNWYTDKEYPTPARSACTFCPYRKNAEWQRMKTEDPLAFQEAVEFDEKIRQQPKLKGKAFIHRSLQPLSQIDFLAVNGLDPGFNEECEGMCGV